MLRSLPTPTFDVSTSAQCGGCYHTRHAEAAGHKQMYTTTTKLGSTHSTTSITQSHTLRAVSKQRCPRTLPRHVY